MPSVLQLPSYPLATNGAAATPASMHDRGSGSVRWVARHHARPTVQGWDGNRRRAVEGPSGRPPTQRDGVVGRHHECSEAPLPGTRTSASPTEESTDPNVRTQEALPASRTAGHRPPTIDPVGDGIEIELERPRTKLHGALDWSSFSGGGSLDDMWLSGTELYPLPSATPEPATIRITLPHHGHEHRWRVRI